MLPILRTARWIALAACIIATGLATLSYGQIAALKEAYKDDFLIGVALGGNVPEDYTRTELTVIKSHFNAVTPENCMKPRYIHPEEGQWDFAQADDLVRFAQANGLQVFGHSLVRRTQTGDWFFEDGGQKVSREKLLERLKAHIETMVGRYKGQIRGWDVVNEAIADGGKDDLRPTQWRTIIGDDYIIEAFRFAHAADPQCELQYNDCGIEAGVKRDRAIRLVKQLQQAGVPLTTVGIEGHWVLDKVPYADLETAIEEFRELGVKVAITELDISVVPRIAIGAGNSIKGVTSKPPLISDAILKRQADEYAKLFALFHKHRDAINRVTIWGLNDCRSWLTYWQPDYPLLFDEQCKPKPALQAVLDVVANRGNEFVR
jgi:endo-1,4-beta-xylanase